MRSVIIILIIVTGGLIPQSDKYSDRRERMVREQIIEREITDNETLKAMRKVPRHLFVPGALVDQAYEDRPLSIGYGQTISQPYIVACMTEASKPSALKKVLEIGTGSGYQAAILAEITDSVFTIEIVPELALEAYDRFKKLGYSNVISKYGDGYGGWPEKGPFDIIIVTAAPEKIPQPLIDQLAENGRMVIPVGTPLGLQELLLLVKEKGKIKRSRLSFVRFVPFMRGEE